MRSEIRSEGSQKLNTFQLARIIRYELGDVKFASHRIAFGFARSMNRALDCIL